MTSFRPLLLTATTRALGVLLGLALAWEAASQPMVSSVFPTGLPAARLATLVLSIQP